MLARQQRLIQGVTNQSEIGVQYQEVTHLQSCFSLMATTAALLAGFEFTVFSLETESVGEYSELHISTVIYMVIASFSLAINLGVVCMSTLASMMGPGLALRGPDGSVRIALDGMRDEYRRVSDVFMLGIYTFFAMVIALVWYEFEYVVAAPVSCIMLIATILLAIFTDRIKIRFAVPNDPYAPRRSLSFWRRPSPASLGPNAALAAAVLDNSSISPKVCKNCQKSCPQTAIFCAKCGSKFASSSHQKKWRDVEAASEEVQQDETKNDDRHHMTLSLRNAIYHHENSNNAVPLKKRGILLKRGKNLRKHTWNERFFQVEHGALSYWDRDQTQLLRSILLAGVALKCEPIDGSVSEDLAILSHAPTHHVFALTLKQSNYRILLAAPTAEEMTAWIIAISRNSNPTFAPKPQIKGVLNARPKPTLTASSSLSMKSFDAKLTCSLLSLSRNNFVEHQIQIAKAEHWDGKGHLRHYDFGILVTAEDGQIWQLQTHNADDYYSWLAALTDCVVDHDDLSNTLVIDDGAIKS
uniref:PH domain-containing protein n=1 Tax=Aureoumbra lagunensis TaxID=44058 RepID=A0A7S3K6A5_9STRA